MNVRQECKMNLFIYLFISLTCPRSPMGFLTLFLTSCRSFNKNTETSFHVTFNTELDELGGSPKRSFSEANLSPQIQNPEKRRKTSPPPIQASMDVPKYSPQPAIKAEVDVDMALGIACRWGSKCTKPGCAYSHSGNSLLDCNSGFACPTRANGCSFKHPPVLCHFGSNCTRESCTFSHHTKCRYGELCSIQGCKFAHPATPGVQTQHPATNGHPVSHHGSPKPKKEEQQTKPSFQQTVKLADPKTLQSAFSRQPKRATGVQDGVIKKQTTRQIPKLQSNKQGLQPMLQRMDKTNNNPKWML